MHSSAQGGRLAQVFNPGPCMTECLRRNRRYASVATPSETYFKW